MIEEKNGISFVSFSVFGAAKDLTAAVSLRHGGVSEAPFASLNMSFSTGDEPEAVIENRRRFLTALGIEPADIISCMQVHGTHIEVVSAADLGRGALEKTTALPACDGLVTNARGVPLTMNFADCTPLLFYDPVHRAIGLSHGGWRGTAGDIAGKTVSLMAERYGTKPEDLLAAIGPAIGGCSFEVGADVIEAFAALFVAADMKEMTKEKGKGKYLFDLPAANRKLMLRAGIPPEHIEDAGICTYCHVDDFFSYRKEKGQTGRHMAVMMLRE